MTLKRDKKREIVRKQLMEKEQESTHSLVSKFSKEMINLIQTKEREVLVSIRNNKSKILFGLNLREKMVLILN